MAGEIFIEAREVEVLGLPTGAMHLYLVFRDTNGQEYVIRSGPENELFPGFGDMEIEANVPIGESSDDRGGDTPEDRSSTPLDFPGLTDDEAWAIMVKYALMIDAADYDYDVIDENSNAFIGAMLAAAGGDPFAMLPEDVSSGDAVGFENYDNIMEDVPPPSDGTVYGTSGGNQIAGIQIDEVIRALGGNDVVWGGRGNDDVFGGSGADRLFGQDGRDSLQGESGADQVFGGGGDDVLRGGMGADLLDGGAGRNVLWGGADADVFRFAEASSSRVKDFQNGVDRLWIVDDVAVGFDDLAISSFGAQGQHTRIVYEDRVIEVLDVNRSLMDPSDFGLLVA